MRRRAKGPNDAVNNGVEADTESGITLKSADDANEKTLAHQVSPLIPAVVVIQRPEQVQALAYIVTARGTIRSWGYAEETRYEEVWCRRGHGAIVLEKVREERQDAFALSVEKACLVACSQLNGSGRFSQVSSAKNGTGDLPESASALVALLGSAAKVLESRLGSPTVGFGHSAPRISTERAKDAKS